MLFRRKFSRRPRRFSRRPRRVYRKKVSKGVRRYVKKAIHRQLENKQYVMYGQNNSVTGPTANTAPTFATTMLPYPIQGSAQGQRIGDKIRLLGCNVKYNLSFSPYDATVNPKGECLVHLIIARCLNSINANPASSIPAIAFTDFFRAGTSSVSFQGNSLDCMLPINEAYWSVVWTKTHKLGTLKSNDFTSGSAAVQVAGNEALYCTNGSFRLPMKKIHKILKFDDATQYPTNTNLYLFAYAVPLEAQGTYSATNIPARLSFVLDWKYEDA